MWPEVPPVLPYERGIEELTGVRPYKGTLMYYRQLGVYDPYEAAEAPEPQNPGQRTSDLIYYLEQSHHELPPGRHQLLGQRVRAHNAADAFRPQAPRRGGKARRQQVRPEQSRELIGRPRPGRATELFQQGRVRADHHVVDETNVCPVPPRSSYKPGPRFTLKKSPWSAACDSSFGDPRDAFEEVAPPPKERLLRQPPATARLKQPKQPSQLLPGYSEMDYARAPPRGGGHHHHMQQQQQVRTSSSWKGGPVNQHGQSFKRFHAGVVPYETDFNRKATGWQSNYFHEDPTDFIFPQDDLDSWKSPSLGSGGHGGGGHPTQYGDYNPRPKSWQTAGQQEEEEEPYVPLQQRRSAFEQQEQQYHHHHQQQQQQQQRHPGHAPRPGRGSAAQRQDYAGPRTWGGSLIESDEL